jgi:hypothetical protein
MECDLAVSTGGIKHITLRAKVLLHKIEVGILAMVGWKL